MTKAIAAMTLACGLVLSLAGCDGSHEKGTSSPSRSVSTTEVVTTTRTVQILSDSDDSLRRTFGFTGERGRTSISYKLADPGSITILVVDPDGKIIDGMDDRGSGDGSFSLDFGVPGDYSLKVSNPKRVPYKISVSQTITN